VTVPVGLALIWAVAVIAAIFIGFRTAREIVREVQADRENKRVADLRAAAIRDRALAEDAEVAMLDALYELPSFKEPAT
jgi:hypothetical protein